MIACINVRAFNGGAVSTVLTVVLLVVAATMRDRAIQVEHNPFTPLVLRMFRHFRFRADWARLWLYSYEQVASVAEEVENPQRNYPIRWHRRALSCDVFPPRCLACRARRLAEVAHRFFPGRRCMEGRGRFR